MIKINPIKTSLFATSMALLTSCGTAECEKLAKLDALPYLSAKELMVAENTAESLEKGVESFMSRQLVYWDSILVEHKIKDAYYEGKKYAVDVYNGKSVEKTEYPVSLDKPKFDLKLSQDEIIEGLKDEIAEFKSAKDFYELREKEPDPFWDIGDLDSYKAVKFWRDIRTAFRQSDAFEKGVKEANDSINELNIPQMQMMSVK